MFPQVFLFGNRYPSANQINFSDLIFDTPSMKNLKFISSFVFDKAQYLIEDSSGNVAKLKIDYYHNKYEILHVKGNLNSDLLNELSNIAEDLLKRKHMVNFANL